MRKAETERGSALYVVGFRRRENLLRVPAWKSFQAGIPLLFGLGFLAFALTPRTSERVKRNASQAGSRIPVGAPKRASRAA